MFAMAPFVGSVCSIGFFHESSRTIRKWEKTNAAVDKNLQACPGGCLDSSLLSRRGWKVCPSVKPWWNPSKTQLLDPRICRQTVASGAMNPRAPPPRFFRPSSLNSSGKRYWYIWRYVTCGHPIKQNDNHLRKRPKSADSRPPNLVSWNVPGRSRWPLSATSFVVLPCMMWSAPRLLCKRRIAILPCWPGSFGSLGKKLSEDGLTDCFDIVSLASSYHKFTHDSCVVRLIDITLLHWTKWNYVKALCIACCGIFCYYTRLYYFIWTFILQHSIDCCCGRNCIMHYNATCICYLMSCNVMLCYAARSCTMLENDAIPYHVISYRRCACRCSSFIFFLSLPMKYLKRWWLEDKVHII